MPLSESIRKLKAHERPVKASVFLHPLLHKKATAAARKRGESLSEFMAALAALETGWKQSNVTHSRRSKAKHGTK